MINNKLFNIIKMNSLYIVELNKEEYHSTIKIITENKTKVKRTLIVDDNDIELVIYCDSKFVDLLKSKDIEINPYKLIGIKKKSSL